MFNFKLLKKENADSKEIRATIENFDSELEAGRVNLEILQGRRGDVILEGDDSAIDDIESFITAQNRSIEQFEKGNLILRERLIKAEAAEEAASLNRKCLAAEKAAKKGLKCIADYGKHAQAIRDVMLDLVAIEALVKETNQALHAAGDSRHIKGPNQIARCVPDEIIPAHTRTIPSKGGWNQKLGFGDPEAKTAGILPKSKTVQEPEKVIPGHVNRALQEVVYLPAVDMNELGIWPDRGPDGLDNVRRTVRQPTHQDHTKYIEEIEKRKARLVA